MFLNNEIWLIIQLVKVEIWYMQLVSLMFVLSWIVLVVLYLCFKYINAPYSLSLLKIYHLIRKHVKTEKKLFNIQTGVT